MATQKMFIGRKTEIDLIKTLFQTDSTRALLFRGKGGLGKTRLLLKAKELAESHQGIWGREIRKAKLALVQEFTSSEWSKEFIRGSQLSASEVGLNLIMTDAHLDKSQMVIDLNEVINERPDAIIISLGSFEELRPGIERAIRLGIKVLTFDNELERIDGLTTRIAQEDYSSALLLAEKMAEDLNYEGEIAVIAAQGHTRQERRLQALEATIKKYPYLNIAVRYGSMEHEAEEITRKSTKEILQKHPTVRAIWATFDEYARGASLAIAETKKSDISVYGFDLCSKDQEYMKQPDSRWRTTVAINPAEAGSICIQLATQAVYGFALRRFYSLQLKIFTQEELGESMDSLSIAPSNFGSPTWLRTLQSAIKENRSSHLLVGPILDFDDRTLHIPENLEKHILNIAGNPDLQEYQQRRGRLTSLLMDDTADHAEIEFAKQEVRASFVRSINQLTETRRLVLFLDTLEKLSASSTQHLFELLKQLKNTLCICASRPKEQDGENDNAVALEAAMESAAQCINLKPLTYQDSLDYLAQKQEQLGVVLEPNTAEKLLTIADGRPILIDLAVEFAARSISLQKIPDLKISDWEQMSLEKREEVQNDLEEILVNLISGFSRRIEGLFLALSRIYPLTVPFISHLLKISLREAQILYSEAQGYVFVKTLPGDQGISLHDEMRRMIVNYIWPTRDPDQDRQQRDSRLAISYIKKRIAEFNSEEFIKFRPFMSAEQDASVREWWALREQLVFHSLYAEPLRGWREFVEAFDDATDAHKLEVRDGLVHQFDILKPIEMTQEAEYEVRRRIVRNLIDKPDYDQAGKELHAIVNMKLTSHQRFDVLILAGKFYMDCGELTMAENSLLDAQKLYEEEPELRRWQGNTLNLLGQVHRRMGLIDQASDEYKRALELAVETRNETQSASILNNLGYLAALSGRYPEAENFSQKAYGVWKRLGQQRGLGMCLSTLGEIHRYWGKYNDAMSYYSRSLEIFEPEDDKVWMMRLYSYLGAVYRLAKKYKEAEDNLLAALAFEIPTELPWTRHVFGCLKRDLGFLKEARDQFVLSDKQATELHDKRTQMNNMVALAELDYEQWRIEGDTFVKQVLKRNIFDYYAKISKDISDGYGFLHHAARVEHVLANLLFDEGLIDQALDFYARSYLGLAQRTGGYGPLTFADECQQLENRILLLSQRSVLTALEWCEILEERWKASQQYGESLQELLSRITTLRVDIKLTTKMPAEK